MVEQIEDLRPFIEPIRALGYDGKIGSSVVQHGGLVAVCLLVDGLAVQCATDPDYAQARRLALSALEARLSVLEAHGRASPPVPRALRVHRLADAPPDGASAPR